MKLSQLLQALTADGSGMDSRGAASAGADPEITGLYYRAQEVTPGGLFVAVKGYSADGHDFIDQAVARGAVAVVCQRPVAAPAAVVVRDTRRALAALAAEFYGRPSRAMTLVGITGTNGKTTTSYLIERILQAAGHAVGVIGTINYRYGGGCFDNPVTTPESLDLQRILAEMRSAGTTHVVMEVSSHALALQRIHACHMDVAVFTNLSRDHLDFHADMADYWASKRLLFTRYLQAGESDVTVRAVINGDDPYGRQLAGDLTVPHWTTGNGDACDLWSAAARFRIEGLAADLHTPMGTVAIRSPLAGRHNLENIRNAAGAALALSLPLAFVAEGIRSLVSVPGRLERVPDAHMRRAIFVDYAHTPDALEKALATLRELTAGRIICVFGCGGGRDRTKRPLMGAIAGRLADLSVVTSDNPRNEPPDQIIAEILAGMTDQGLQRYDPAKCPDGRQGRGYTVEPDRRRAITLGIRLAGPRDTVLIAGKGHETYQLIAGVKHPFDDRQVAAAALAAAEAAVQ